MPRYAFECEWDGCGAHGTAPQLGDIVTLHSMFSEACTRIGEPAARLRCSSRLDAGVSAYALPIHVDVDKDWNPHALARALNGNLPERLAMRRVACIDDSGDHMWDVLTAGSTKSYRYSLACQPWRPRINRQCMWVKRLPQAALLPVMAAQIIGEKDLSGFACLRGDGSDLRDPVRVYTAAAWQAQEQCVDGSGSCAWTFYISGRGFLYKQVRGLVGAMVAVAQGSYPLSAFEHMLHAGRASAQRSGNIAPAEGLALMQVAYDHPPAWMAIES